MHTAHYPDWQTKNLGEVCDIEKVQHKTGNNLPYVGMEDIESNTGRLIGSTKIKSVLSSTFYFTSSHVLYGRLCGYLNKVALPNFKGHCSTEIFPIKPLPRTDKKFLFYWLSFDETVKKINKTCTGTRMPRANMKEVLNFEFPLPPLPEQKRIVKILDETFENVARAKANAEKNLRNSKELFESYLQSVFTSSGDGWEEKKVDAICSVEYGYTEKAKNKGDYRFIRITDTNENGLLMQENKMYIDSFREVDKYILSDGDLLMARTGASAGNVLLFESNEESVFASYLIRMKFEKEVSSKLYWYFSKSKLYWDQVRQLSAGSAQPQFNGGALKQIVFLFPKSLKTQKQIVTRLNALSAQTKKLENIYQHKIDNLDELKKSILAQAFAGKL
ncbi:MAG: restriction endonuclease subunit S [Bacteriovorax sp.]|nr:restriction endonuclease subunit S [Bacteriovorax sp.]